MQKPFKSPAEGGENIFNNAALLNE